MFENPVSGELPVPLADVLARVDSLRNGLCASASLAPEEAVLEASLLLDDALRRCREEMVHVVPGELDDTDVRLLLTAERYWLEVLRDMLHADVDLPAEHRLERVLAAFPG